MSFQEQAHQAIRHNGGRMTGQRRLIIDLLAEADDTIDADAIYQRAIKQDATISLATVYRTIHMLEEAELVTPHYRERDHARKYYRVATRREQYYFTCRKCHRVIPFRTPSLNSFLRELGVRLNADVQTACLCVDGLCDACREDQLP
ncbi:MAG: transcriptional repressor [Caldilineaceae bacterium]|nr:transcriptional repressor [Caldilineaceae bacterium]